MITLFVKEATTIDFSYLDEKRGLLGETYIVDIYIHGEPDSEGILLDFSDIKHKIKENIDFLVEHQLLVPSNSPLLAIDFANESTKQESVSVDWQLPNKTHIRVVSPKGAVSEVPTGRISENSVAQYLNKTILPMLPNNILSIEFKLYPETINGPYYHYSHGLKKHTGNCQRIAHGHRSKIEIYDKNKVSTALSKQWAETFRDIYIGKEEDVDSNFNDPNYIRFNYEAPQGYFEITIPRVSVYLMKEDTTIENIASHIHQKIKQNQPDLDIAVHAYEGLNKGAIKK